MSLIVLIVFYNPSEDCILHAIKVANSYSTIVIDNSDKQLLGDYPFSYICNYSNVGIAKAQNIGILKAKQMGATHVLFLDQDSKIDNDSIESLIAEFNEVRRIDQTCVAIGPLIVNKDTGVPYKNTLHGEKRMKVSTIISSGMLADINAFDAVGLMEEQLFIDVVDHEWCWRCISKGLSIYLTSKVTLPHMVGVGVRRICGIEFLWASPSRYYYKYRNSLWMLPRPYVPFRWKFRTMIRLILDYCIFMIWSLFSSEKRICFSNASKGIFDGFFKRRGYK